MIGSGKTTFIKKSFECESSPLDYNNNGFSTIPLVRSVSGLQTPIRTTTVVRKGVELVNNVPTVGQLPIKFVPYVEKLSGESILVEPVTVVPTIGGGVYGGQYNNYPENTTYNKVNREFVEFYLNECKRHVAHIMRKMEGINHCQTIVPTVFPKTFEQQMEALKIGEGIKTEMPFINYSQMLEGGRLLQLLTQVATMESVSPSAYLSKVQELFSTKFAYYKAIEEDLVLNHFISRTQHYRNIMDTIYENIITSLPSSPSKLRVLEITPSVGGGHFFGAKHNLAKFYPHIAPEMIEYHYLPVGVTNYPIIHDEYLSEINKSLPYEIKKVEWSQLGVNFTPRGELVFVDRQFKDYDVVIMNCGMSSFLPMVGESEYEMKRLVKHLCERVCRPETGFFFVHELVNQLEMFNMLNRLEQLTLMRGTNTYHKYMGEMQWRRVIEECGAGLLPICVKSDIAELASMFLYRRPFTFGGKYGYGYETPSSEYYYPSTPSTTMKVINIDEFSSGVVGGEEWLNKVREYLCEPKYERVYLVSERLPTSNLVKILYGLRRSEMYGEKLRCLFLSEKQPVIHYSGSGHVVPTVLEISSGLVKPTGVQYIHLIEMIKKADMFMNVFKNGVWGSFRPHYYTLPTTTTYYPTTTTTPFSYYPTTYPIVSKPYSTLVNKYYEEPITVGSTRPQRFYRPEIQIPTVYDVLRTVQKPIISIPTTTTYTTTIKPQYKYRSQPSSYAATVTVNPMHTYIVSNGLSLVGLELCQWLCEQGATRIILTTPVSINSIQQQQRGGKFYYPLRRLQSLKEEFGCFIQLLDELNVREESHTMSLVKEALKMSAKIGGVFYLEQEENVETSEMPSCYFLDKITRDFEVMPETGFFVLINTLIKKPYYSTYPTYGGVSTSLPIVSVLEKLVEQRRREGRHSLYIQWGLNNGSFETQSVVEPLFTHELFFEMPTETMQQRVISCIRVLESLLYKSCEAKESAIWSSYVPLERLFSYPTTTTTTTTYETPKSLVRESLIKGGLVELLFKQHFGIESSNIKNYFGVTLGELFGFEQQLPIVRELKQVLETVYNYPIGSWTEFFSMPVEKLRMVELKYPQGIYECIQRPIFAKYFINQSFGPQQPTIPYKTYF
jgi:hypothetical protein